MQSNAVVKLAGTLQNQIPNGLGGVSYIQTKLNEGGVLDMNGNSETVDVGGWLLDEMWFDSFARQSCL